MPVHLPVPVKRHQVDHVLEGALQLRQVMAERLLELKQRRQPLARIISIVTLLQALPIDSNQFVSLLVLEVVRTHFIDEEGQVEVKAV